MLMIFLFKIKHYRVNLVKLFMQRIGLNIDLLSHNRDEFENIYHLNNEQINKFKYFNNRSDFYEGYNVRFFTILVDSKIVGLAHIRKNPYIDETYWLSYLCILDEYQNNGLASLLSEYIFTWFKENDLQFETSSYSESGFIKLKPLFNKLSQKCGVKFIDKETKI